MLVPRFDFRPVAPPPPVGPREAPPFVTGGGGRGPIIDGPPISVNPETGGLDLWIGGLAPLKSEEAKRICAEDLDELIVAVMQDPEILKRGLFDENVSPPQVNIAFVGRIVREKYPQLDEDDQEAIRQRAVAKFALVSRINAGATLGPIDGEGGGGSEVSENRSFIEKAKEFALNVRELSVDMIDQLNPFGRAYAILSKAIDEKNLRELHELITARRAKVSPEDAERYAEIAKRFPKTHGRWASPTSKDLWERTVAEGALAYMRYKRDGLYDKRRNGAVASAPLAASQPAAYA